MRFFPVKGSLPLLYHLSYKEAQGQRVKDRREGVWLHMCQWPVGLLAAGHSKARGEL